MKPDLVKTWAEAAIADGWKSEPMYTNSTDKFKLHRDGFICHVYYGDNIAVWGPDGLALEIPDTYNWDELVANLKLCAYCGDMVYRPVRLGFAGRACIECRVKLVDKIEYPGWCD